MEKNERIVFEKNGFRLSEIPYNYMIVKSNKSVYYTSIQSAINYLARVSQLTVDELKELTKGCTDKPYRFNVEDRLAKKREQSRMARHRLRNA